MVLSPNYRRFRRVTTVSPRRLLAIWLYRPDRLLIGLVIADEALVWIGENVFPADTKGIDGSVLPQSADDFARLGIGSVEFFDDPFLFHAAAMLLKQAQHLLLVAEEFWIGLVVGCGGC